ncbi:ribonuclease D [Stackebrandtia albiflava]|uniref:Ribonuclease D n=1 Tax=Stackebrandtia albiflava TaxID=406432 RepID=A0A562VBJ1_9ACTN|nr:ribonuclease D [Stackebrandtia albiflava]TWJ15228.1 ribonuclease D [Stackebrandtia albiflava]
MSEDHTEAEAADPVLLTEPRDGVPEVVADDTALEAVLDALTAGSGPVAVDAERASGFRYLPRAYLIQLRRNGSGTFMIDPTRFDDLTGVGRVLSGTEWILHAASQDLACLAEVGMRPSSLFDTELAARLCGMERVGLAALTERLLGYRLEKHHSAADWSTRPLPADWLKYAALDVELLIDLRDRLDAELRAQGKRDWAAEEFEALTASRPAEPRKEPWRRTSGIHRVRGARALARVRELWLARDELARSLDKAPSKIVPDPAISDAAIADPSDAAGLLAIPGFQRRHGRANMKRWLAALARARDAASGELPSVTPLHDGPPATHRWASRDPEAAARLKRARHAVLELAEEHLMPAENLIAPAIVRGLAWQPPAELSVDRVREAMAAAGARQWQVSLAATALTEALAD